MTREEQKKLKELKKALPQILKDGTKKYKLKKTDYMVWHCKNDLFYDLLLDIRATDDGHCVCGSIEKIKPLWLDDLLWDFLKMESNKEEPLSLRAVGAFTVNGSEIFKDSCELKKWDVNELEQCVQTYLEHFHQSILSSDIKEFLDNMEVSPYHLELRKALTLVHCEKYKEALEYLNDLGDGVFENEGISINEAIRKYCRNK